MALPTEEHIVAGSRNETPVRMLPLAHIPKSAGQHFQEYRRERPGVVALWCFGRASFWAGSSSCGKRVTVHGAGGDWSIFRPINVVCRHDLARKHGPFPLPAP